VDLDQIYRKLNTIEHKLDKHLERLAKVEVRVDWASSKGNVAITLLVAVATGAVLALFKL
jgi:hypothetical protein